MSGTAQPGPPERVPGDRILLVSQDLALRERLYDLLTPRGFSVLTAASGRIGREMLTKELFGLIIANSTADEGPGWGLPDFVRRFDTLVPILLILHPDEGPPDSRTASDVQAYLRSDAADAAILELVKRWTLPPHTTRPLEPIDYPGTILLIDDEPGALQALQDFLEPRGCRIVTALSGEEGLAKLETCQPRLVILDVKMPGMDGLLTLRKMKQQRPRVPIIIATAVEDRHLMGQALSLGAYDYVTKPFDLASLQGLLSRVKDTVTG